jgi:hypothetical protein
MARRSVALILMCLGAPIIFSSCTKKAFKTAATPAIALGRGLASFGKAIFGCNANSKKKVSSDTPDHSHKKAEKTKFPVPVKTEEPQTLEKKAAEKVKK